MGRTNGLRNRVLGGGAFLVLRQGFGILLSFLGLTLLLREIGPKEYGLYSIALAIYTYLLSLGQLGVGVYLVRGEGGTESRDFQQVTSLLFVSGIVLTFLAMAILPFLKNWLALDNFLSVALVIFSGLPVGLATIPLLAYLEREMYFKKIALIEIKGQLAYYLVALLLAYKGFGVWALVWGWWSQQLLVFWNLRKAAPIPFSWFWEWARMRDIVYYGISFSSSIWIWQMRGLVVPLIVGKYLGAEEVGYINLATRLVESLGFVKTVAWRISLSAFAKVQRDKTRLATAIVEASELQVLGTGLPFLAFASAGTQLVPSLFGQSWAPVMFLFPFVATSYLVNAVFNMHSSALYVLKRNWDVAVFHLAHVSLLAFAAWIGVRELGLLGYGWAELIALLSYGIIYIRTVRSIGPLDQKLVTLWVVVISLTLFWQLLGLWTWLLLVGVFVAPFSRARLGEVWRVVASYAKIKPREV